MSATHPLAADLLDEQLDKWTVQGVSERRRLQLLRTFLPPATWAASPTPELLAAIARTEQAIKDTEDLCADIRGAIKKLRMA